MTSSSRLSNLTEIPVYKDGLDTVASAVVKSGARQFIILSGHDDFREALGRRLVGRTQRSSSESSEPDPNCITIHVFSDVTQEAIESSRHSIFVCRNPLIPWPRSDRQLRGASSSSICSVARRLGRRTEIRGVGSPLHFLVLAISELFSKQASIYFWMMDLANRLSASDRYFTRLCAIEVIEVRDQ